MLSTTNNSVLASASYHTQNLKNKPPNSTTNNVSSLPNTSIDSIVMCVTVRRGSFLIIGPTMHVVSKISGLGGSKKAMITETQEMVTKGRGGWII